MKYQEHRNSIKTGDILAWSHKGWKTLYDIKLQIIRLFTESEYVHVGLAWVHAGRVFVIESVQPTVRIVPLSNFLPAYVIHMHQPLYKDALERAFELVGKGKYSSIEAIKAYFGKNKDSNAWQCAEFVQEILYTNGIDLNCMDTPSEVVIAAQKLGKEMVFIE
jgi:hypothetical protein